MISSAMAVVFRILGIVDDFTRGCLALVADTSLSGRRVGRQLDAIIADRGKPAACVSDNGTELTSTAILREQWQGAKTVEVCRKHGVSDATFYKWKAKYGGREVSDARRLKALEDENTKLKKLLAEAMLDIAMLRDMAARKW